LGLTETANAVPVLGEPHNKKTVDKMKNVNSSDKGGNSQKYRIAKLKRDHPAIAQRLMDGEFKSVSEAERAAGVGKPLMSPVQKVVNMINKLSVEDRAELKKLGF